MENKYYRRVADSIIEKKLNTSGAVLIVGPKNCGKSTTAKRLSKSQIYMQDPKTKSQNIKLAEIDSSFFLNKEAPLLIDEWQVIPFIWDSIRYEIDKREAFGQFLLTGSSNPFRYDKNMHSGIGRITRYYMRTMSLYESNDSNGYLSIEELFKNNQKIETQESNLTLLDYAYLVCRGGWPSSLHLKNKTDALEIAKNYYDGLINNDLNLFASSRKNSIKTNLILKSYSRLIGSNSTYTTILEDLKNQNSTISIKTINEYILILKNLFVIEELPMWNVNLRSKTSLKKIPTKYFVDPSIACAALGIYPNDLINDLNTFGFLFENMCIRDLRIYADKIGGEVYKYSDRNNLEVDAIIHLQNGEWGAIEIKLGSQQSIDLGIKNLLKLKNNVLNPPKFLMVITAGNICYKTEEEIIVCPIGMLKY